MLIAEIMVAVFTVLLIIDVFDLKISAMRMESIANKRPWR